MAVAETSSSQGTAASGDAAPLGRAVNTAALATLSFALLCGLGAIFWALPAPQAHAQVVAYRQAPGNQQPTILQTANGVPQVNIWHSPKPLDTFHSAVRLLRQSGALFR